MKSTLGERFGGFVLRGLFWLSAMLALPALAGTLGTASVNPGSIAAGGPAAVTVSIAITDPNYNANSANLLRLNADGSVQANLGGLRDDGLNGDAVAGDKVYSLRVTLQEAAAGSVRFQVSAAFRGELRRTLSNVVTLTVTAANATVPNVVGLTQSAATTAITGAGLTVGAVTQANSNTVPAGSVISQNPTAGASVAPGSAVALVVSIGPANVTVPNVVGLTQSAATTAITGAGLTLGTVTQANSNTVPAGSVISQNPTAGASVAPGSAVALVVSVGPANVTVPNVVGLTQSAATMAITGAGLTVGTVTQANSNTVPAGSVISQNPTAGASVAPGSAVALVVSIGPVAVTVPNVVGLTQSAATTAITNAGLTLGTVTQANSNTVPAGSVISQNPTAGASVAPGSAVALVVSIGPANVTVPNVVGLTQSAATTAITNADLTLGTVTQANSNTVPAGSVISQNPTAGASVAPGSAVALVVSIGPANVTVPNVVGLTQSAATTAITNAGLTLGTVTQANSNTVPAGSVISQNPTAGASVAPGSAVALVVSIGPANVTVPNVVGLTQSAASTAITGAGLTVGTVTQANSNTVPAGSVISQNPTAGASVAPGSAVALVVSIGPANVTVPNVVGLTQSAATTAITGAGLTVGTVTLTNSNTVPAGNVISQNPTAGSSVAPGSAVALTVSVGPAGSSTPASMSVTLAKPVANGGETVAFTQAFFDAQGAPFTPAPQTTCSVSAGAGSTGTLPTVQGNSVSIPANAKGVFTLSCAVPATTVSASQGLTVLLPVTFKTVNGQQVPNRVTTSALYSAMSKSLVDMNGQLAALKAALQANDPAAIAAARTALVAVRTGVNRTEYARSYPLALLQGRFPPTLAQVQAAGLGPNANDNPYRTTLSSINTKLGQITSFVAGIDPLNLTDAQGTQFNQYATDLAALLAQLRGLSPSPYGVVQAKLELHAMLGSAYPALVHAIVNKTEEALVKNGLVTAANATADGPRFAGLVTPQQFYATTHPAFFGLIDLMLGESLIGQLINDMYGPAIQYLENAMILLTLQAIGNQFSGPISIQGIVTGASLSVHIFNAGGSFMEGTNFNSVAALNDVWLIGPDHINAARDIVSLFQGIPQGPSSWTDLAAVEQFFEKVWDIVQNAIAAAQNAVDVGARTRQPPDSVSFVDFGIFCDSCQALQWDLGFNSVYSTGGINIPSPVLFIVRDQERGGFVFNLQSYNFVKAAPR